MAKIDSITEKQEQFNAAMVKYENQIFYKWVGNIVSLGNLLLQVMIGILAFRKSIDIIEHAFVVVVAFLLADFVNGLVHMYMDNNDDYQSIAGPLVASFHLHHRTPKYKQKNLVEVYYHESGSKIWLLFFMFVAAILIASSIITGIGSYLVFYFSIFSSVAEVSHYLCHVPAKSKAAEILQKAGILMSPKYHSRHHIQDNTNYTFLNCVTDPIVSFIAKLIYKGYKDTTDLHFARYTGKDTENRD